MNTPIVFALRPRFSWRAVASVLTVSAGLIGSAGAAPASSAVVVPVVTVQAGTTALGFELDGQIQAQRQATVAAQIGGTVQALLVKAGDAVRTGQALAHIDGRSASADLSRGDAAVAQAQAQRDNARLNAERTRELHAKGFVSQAAQDMADTQLKAAQAGLREAEAARSQAALARGFTTVTAPFDGLVQATLLEAGDLAGPGRPVLTLYAPGALRAVVQVPSSRAAAAQAATQVQVQLPNGSWVAPVRRTVLPATDPVAQTVEWRFDLPATPAAAVSPGQSVRLKFEGAAAQPGAGTGVLSVPASAVLRRGELTAVYVAQGSQFVLRAVRAGASRSGRVELLAGVKSGERVAQEAVRAGLAGAVPAAAAQ
jgi:RND family efflux transporter MFP subunit